MTQEIQYLRRQWSHGIGEVSGPQERTLLTSGPGPYKNILQRVK